MEAILDQYNNLKADTIDIKISEYYYKIFKNINNFKFVSKIISEPNLYKILSIVNASEFMHLDHIDEEKLNIKLSEYVDNNNEININDQIIKIQGYSSNIDEEYDYPIYNLTEETNLKELDNDDIKYIYIGFSLTNNPINGNIYNLVNLMNDIYYAIGYELIFDDVCQDSNGDNNYICEGRLRKLDEDEQLNFAKYIEIYKIIHQELDNGFTSENVKHNIVKYILQSNEFIFKS